ncbi:MAG: helix-turn-helix domain-containing protein [Thermonemataceae bacterium]
MKACKSLGEQLKKYRKQLDLSQGEIAKQLGVSQNCYSKMESNQIRRFTLDRLEEIAQLFGISLADLLGITSNTPAEYQTFTNEQGTSVHLIETSTLLKAYEKQIADLQAERDRLLTIIAQITQVPQEK